MPKQTAGAAGGAPTVTTSTRTPRERLSLKMTAGETARVRAIAKVFGKTLEQVLEDTLDLLKPRLTILLTDTLPTMYTEQQMKKLNPPEPAIEPQPAGELN